MKISYGKHFPVGCPNKLMGNFHLFSLNLDPLLFLPHCAPSSHLSYSSLQQLPHKVHSIRLRNWVAELVILPNGIHFGHWRRTRGVCVICLHCTPLGHWTADCGRMLDTGDTREGKGAWKRGCRLAEKGSGQQWFFEGPRTGLGVVCTILMAD